MAETRLYQDANGDWIVWDGQQKQRFQDKAAARHLYRRLTTMSAIQDWNGTIDRLVNVAEQLLPLVDLANDVYVVNDLQALVDATPAGEYVADSELTKEQAQMAVALLQAFLDFLAQPVGTTGLTPKQILRLRS